jgi:hypothetical protein
MSLPALRTRLSTPFCFSTNTFCSSHSATSERSGPPARFTSATHPPSGRPKLCSRPSATREDKSLETTMGYLHAEALSVGSPLDTLPIILPDLDRGLVVSTDRRPTAPDDERPGRASVGPVYLAPVSLTESKSAPNGSTGTGLLNPNPTTSFAPSLISNNISLLLRAEAWAAEARAFPKVAAAASPTAHPRESSGLKKLTLVRHWTRFVHSIQREVKNKIMKTPSPCFPPTPTARWSAPFTTVTGFVAPYIVRATLENRNAKPRIKQ